MNSAAYRLGILETHPIQYKVPWFRALHARDDLDLTVLYCMLPDAEQQGAGFGVGFQWDLPLLDGYRHHLLRNVARRPSVCRFNGCNTPGLCGVVRDGLPGPDGVARAWDAVVINGWVVRSCLQGLLACRRCGVPAILRCEANDLRPRAGHKTLLHRLLLRQFSAFISIGVSNRAFYRRRGVAAERIFDGFYCVDNERFSSAAATARPRRDELRERWGIPGEAVCFLFVGKFEPKKRPLDILRALAQVDGEAHLLMVGDGEQRAACEVFAADRGLPVTFAGFLNQSAVAEAYGVADCLVLASDFGETWGLTVNEAMVCGLPAIVSERTGCRPDLLKEGETGSVFPFGDCRALAGCMRRVLEDPEHWRAMGRKAKERIQVYSIDGLVSGTMSALRYVTRDRCAGRRMPR